MQTVGRQRPLGVTIISIILWVVGIIGLLAIILGFIGVAAFVHNSVLDAAATVGLLIGAIIAIAEIVLGYRGRRGHSSYRCTLYLVDCAR